MRGVTFGPVGISTHAPARGATRGLQSRHCGISNFNPRPCTRSDPAGGALEHQGQISTHAPARGATSLRPRVQR